MEIDNIKTPEDILQYLEEHIRYGWLDLNKEKHIMTMKDYRKLYRTVTIEETIKYGLGVCVEQVHLMHYLFDKINIPNKMFCCRIYEPDEYNNLEEEEHMHCFLLYYVNGKVYHMEHPNFNRTGIYEYNSEEEAISSIVNYYIELRGGKESPTKEFFDVPVGLTFQEFNAYINNLGTQDC